MAANRNSRYYSQSYEQVDNPGHPDYLENPASSHQPEGTYQDYETYRGFKTVGDMDVAEEPSAGLPPRQQKAGWSRKRKFIIAGAVAACVIIGLAVGLGVGLTQGKDSYDYTPVKGDLYVTDPRPFTQGGATHEDPSNVTDGIGAGEDEYTYYSGKADQFPNVTEWISFEDMWNKNLQFFQTSCHQNGFGKDQTEDEIDSIYNAIQDRAKASLVDHRFILATILQETHGCAKVKMTKSYGGVANPGLMQSNQGTEFSAKHANQSIYDMVQDGTQGTRTGDGLVQNLIYYHNAYAAARGYNSGTMPLSGNLSEAEGATACYVSDLANRLTGWTNAETKCHEENES